MLEQSDEGGLSGLILCRLAFVGNKLQQNEPAAEQEQPRFVPLDH